MRVPNKKKFYLERARASADPSESKNSAGAFVLASSVILSRFLVNWSSRR